MDNDTRDGPVEIEGYHDQQEDSAHGFIGINVFNTYEKYDIT